MNCSSVFALWLHVFVSRTMGSCPHRLTRHLRAQTVLPRFIFTSYILLLSDQPVRRQGWERVLIAPNIGWLMRSVCDQYSQQSYSIPSSTPCIQPIPTVFVSLCTTGYTLYIQHEAMTRLPRKASDPADHVK